MAERAGATSVPQIWINEQHIGGCDQLIGLERSGGLDPLLRNGFRHSDFKMEGVSAWLKKEPQPLRKNRLSSSLLRADLYKGHFFESPIAPNVFRQEWKPAVNVDLNTKSSRVDEEGNHEVVLTLTITAKLEEQTAFLVEVQQAGIFFVSGIEGDSLRQLLATVALTILFPYAGSD